MTILTTEKDDGAKHSIIRQMCEDFCSEYYRNLPLDSSAIPDTQSLWPKLFSAVFGEISVKDSDFRWFELLVGEKFSAMKIYEDCKKPFLEKQRVKQAIKVRLTNYFKSDQDKGMNVYLDQLLWAQLYFIAFQTYPDGLEDANWDRLFSVKEFEALKILNKVQAGFKV